MTKYYQSGLRKLHSAIKALLETTNNWCVNIDNGFINGIIFIDLKKVFDTNDHGISLRKFVHYGVDQNALRRLKSYLNRSQRCYVKWHMSSSKPIRNEVSQCSKIGPLLFLVYMKGPRNFLNNGSPRMYADVANISYSGSMLSEIEQQNEY